MDWTSALLGSFFAISVIFGVTAAALYPIMRRTFLLWIVARIVLFAIMIWSLVGILPTPAFLSEPEVRLLGSIALTLSIAIIGPMMNAYLERRVTARFERRVLRLMLPIGLIAIALLPAVVFAGRLDWLHDSIVAVMLAMLVFSLARLVRQKSQTAMFQSVAWTPALTVAFFALGHELVVGGMMPFFIELIVISLMLEMMVTTVGIASGFMGLKRERDRALADVREARLATALDPLTNIANRRGLERYFNSGGNPRPTGIALIDCDHFKRINDQFGHDVGDRVLCAVAQSLDSQNLFAARLGGEEFVLLLDGPHWKEAAENARQGITDAVRMVVPELPYPITASAGLAHFDAGDTLSSAMKRADQALYAAKEAGRDRSLSLTQYNAKPAILPKQKPRSFTR